MRKIILWLMVGLLYFTGLSCSTRNEFSKLSVQSDVEVSENKRAKSLGIDEGVPPKYLMGEIKIQISPEDKKYLEENCSSCHKLDRVFLTHRAPRSVWEKIMEEYDHKQIGLSREEKERVYNIFQHNMAE